MTLEEITKLNDEVFLETCNKDFYKLSGAVELLIAVARAAKDYSDPTSPIISIEKYQRLAESLADLDSL